MHHIVLFVLTLGVVFPSLTVAQQTPVMEYAALLNSVDVYPDGRLDLDNENDILTTVFLPQGASVEMVLTKRGSEKPLHVQDFYVHRNTKVFASIDMRGKRKEFRFTEPGDYEISFRTGGRVMTTLPFSVYTRSSDDVFDPRTAWYMSGPWSHWAYAFSKLSDGAEGQLEFRMWAKRESFDGATITDVYDVELKKNGDVLATGRTAHVGTQQWRALSFRMSHPESKGGRSYKVKSLVVRDGKYQFVVRKNREPFAVWEMTIEKGKPQLHPRESNTYKPRTEYIVPRYAALTDGTGRSGNTVWMERLSDVAAKSIAAADPKDVAGPTDEQMKRWHWLPMSIDPKRPFHVAVTDIETRSDTHIAAGEDIIVFGTGYPTGVKFMKVGDKKSREIPDGEVYSSSLFHVCGKKIVLVRRNHVFVYDTEKGVTTPIPPEEVTLYNPIGGLHKGNLLNANGYLVAAINKATSVVDGNILKVIDVSGDRPVVIPIKNADYNDRQVSSVAVDAKNGIVAISSAEKKLIGVAKVADLANQYTFDVGDYRGVNRRQIFIDDNAVVYSDEDLKVRVLDPDNPIPRAITDTAFGPSSNGFIVRKGRLVIATTEHFGTRYEMALSDLPEKPQRVPGTGTKIEGTSGSLGMAGGAAIAIDKTVFIAGTPSGGVGAGEHLQVLDEDAGRWVPLLNEVGRTISATDVTTSMGLLAFKSADRGGKTTIGYATYGERISLPGTSGTSKMIPPRVASSGKTAPLQFANDNTYNTNDEKAQSTVKGLLEAEAQIADAYLQIFGKEEGSKKTVDAIVDSLKKNGDDDQVDDYLRASKYVAEEDRPAAKADASSVAVVDRSAVMAALNGEWRAIRFSAQGNDLPDAAIENLRLTFVNGTYVMTMAGELQTGSYEINTASSPMAMDIHIKTGDNAGQKRMGSFKLLEDDRLLIVFATNEKRRPTRFVPDESGDSILAVYRK